jgi:hypothetical protein
MLQNGALAVPAAPSVQFGFAMSTHTVSTCAAAVFHPAAPAAMTAPNPARTIRLMSSIPELPFIAPTFPRHRPVSPPPIAA